MGQSAAKSVPSADGYGKVQRLSFTEYLYYVPVCAGRACYVILGSALHPQPPIVAGDDIVHPFWQQKEQCNELVVGSNPTRGA